MQKQRLSSTSRIWHIVCAVGIIIHILTLDTRSSQAQSGVPTLLDFEDLPLDTAVYTQYDGITFPMGDDPLHPFRIAQPALPTVSGRAALQFFRGTPELSQSDPMSIEFEEAQYDVSVSVGLPQSSKNIPHHPAVGEVPVGLPTGSIGYTVRLQGFSTAPDQEPTLITTSIADSLCTQASPTSITTPLEINDGAARIRYVQIAIVACADPLSNDEIYGTYHQLIYIDNLQYNRPLHPIPREADPPIITRTSPSSGMTIEGSIPGDISLLLQASVTETAIYSVTAQVNGHSPVLMNYYRTGPQTYDASVLLRADDGLVDGTNTVMLRVWDFDRPQNMTVHAFTFTYKGLPPPPPPGDIVPIAFQVTQVIGPGPILLNSTHKNASGDGYIVSDGFGQPLIAGKKTLIRIYGAVAGGPTTAPVAVPAMMNILRADGSEGVVSALPIENMINWSRIPALGGVLMYPASTPDSDPNQNVTNLKRTWNFFLWGDETRGKQVIKITLNSQRSFNSPVISPAAECTSLQTTCQHNNTLEFHLDFTPPQEIDIDALDIHLNGTFNGVNYNDIHPTIAESSRILDGIESLFPIAIHRSYFPTKAYADPGISGNDLVNLVSQLQYRNGKRRFVLGVFPGNQANPPGTFPANENDTVAGLGSLGGLGAWANSDYPIGAAHEIGHNIGLPHASCDHNERGECDNNFPIPHGGIGGFGMDFNNWRVIAPGDTSTPNHAHDLMSYGQDKWISTYTYNLLLDHSSIGSYKSTAGYDTSTKSAMLVGGTIGYDTSTKSAMLVGGTISSSGGASLRPVYRIEVQDPIVSTIDEDYPDRIYTIEGYDTNGNTILIHNFNARELANEYSKSSDKILLFDEIIPFLPNVQRLVVRKGSTLLGEIKNPASGTLPNVSVVTPNKQDIWTSGKLQTIRWNSSSPSGSTLTALIEYSPDGGSTLIPLGRDIAGTEFTVDADELPGSTNARVYIYISDGMNTAVAVSDPFNVALKPPSVHISIPYAHSQVLAHVPMGLESTGFDQQEELSDDQFVWTSDRDGRLGTGRKLTVDNLSAGQHTLTLTITNSKGLTGQDSVPIRVLSPGDYADSAFTRLWQRTDSLVADGQVGRSWYWGLGPNTIGILERWDDAPDGSGFRLVQYFDKSRMEINDPKADPNDPFYVTNSLATVELIGGCIQTNSTSPCTEERAPAEILMSGDPGDPLAPTYAAFRNVANTRLGDHPAPNQSGKSVIATIDHVGKVSQDTAKAAIPLTKIAYYEPTTKHNIPEAFWNFLNQVGPVRENGQVVQAPVSNPWFYATGLPISEAYWARATVGGAVKDVLIQAFERRVLTYTPSNAPEWRVEMGNIGQHYYEWRYETPQK